MAEKNYQQMSEDIINLVGGKNNISKVSHCFTRLRLDLKETEKADLDGLKKVKGTSGAVNNNGQIQVIIGQNDIDDMYNAFLNVSGMKAEVVIDENLDGSKKGSWANRFLNNLAQIFIPVFPALAAGGLLKALLIAANFAHIVDPA
ncbi:MAG: PTS transporter subunit EIIB, partial [Lachnospiraceae bacterium]|nr:PTS transporter subunit EIIB [Lachnospiraceae bacterium]